MFKKFSNKLAVLAVALGLMSALAFVGAPNASAQLFDGSKQEACKGTQLTGGSADCSPAKASGLNNIIKVALNLLSIVVAIAAVIMIIVNGLRFITSGGDSNSVSSAKKGIIYAIVGLVLVALAQFIVQFVINRSTTPPPKPQNGAVYYDKSIRKV